MTFVDVIFCFRCHDALACSGGDMTAEISCRGR
jgi:hypothetical protein